eukprot:TRINITY_DN122214_c0_g1_i1.p1 TRINITY_DN122214_c0_g1~~TRINITY_DN122214_c0_g1_i1.p1  ORF type:complete len:188 (-),score=41.66 TRINITY_DN122214_c0_g1_i1:315-878(-)
MCGRRCRRVVLAKNLRCWDEERKLFSIAGLKLLELGAGTGVMALAMASLGAHVVATEQSERLKLLKRNLERHSSSSSEGPPWSIGKRGGTIDTEELDWFSPGGKVDCDLIVAADVVYTEEVTAALVRCLSQYEVPAVLCVELRTEEVHYAFIDALAAAAFTVHRLPPEMHADGVQSKRVVTYVLTRL